MDHDSWSFVYEKKLLWEILQYKNFFFSLLFVASNQLAIFRKLVHAINDTKKSSFVQYKLHFMNSKFILFLFCSRSLSLYGKSCSKSIFQIKLLFRTQNKRKTSKCVFCSKYLKLLTKLIRLAIACSCCCPLS